MSQNVKILISFLKGKKNGYPLTHSALTVAPKVPASTHCYIYFKQYAGTVRHMSNLIILRQS